MWCQKAHGNGKGQQHPRHHEIIMTGYREQEAHQYAGPRVDLTIQSIHGILGVGTAAIQPMDFTAAVSFKGSARNMQVSSFTMCGRTGNLVIESNPLEVDSSPAMASQQQHDDQTTHSSLPLMAMFNDPKESRRSLQSCSMSTSSSSSSQRPHLKLKLSGTKNPHVPQRSLTTVNRSSLIHQSPSQEEEANGDGSTDGSRGASIYWEAENDVMPDIVELHIVLCRNHSTNAISTTGSHGNMDTEDDSICEEGIAHLLFYGNPSEYGLTTMDLRIKKKPQPQHVTSSPAAAAAATSDLVSNPSSPGLVSFLEDAYIRVQVDVRKLDSSKGSTDDLLLSERYEDEKKMRHIVSKLKEHEEMAALRAKVNRMGLEGAAAAGGEDKKNHSKFPNRFLCSSGLDFGDTVRVLMDAFTKCDGKRRKKASKSLIPIIRTNSTMESTIETRDSLLI